jgi:hypothetical protein
MPLQVIPRPKAEKFVTPRRGFLGSLGVTPRGWRKKLAADGSQLQRSAVRLTTAEEGRSEMQITLRRNAGLAGGLIAMPSVRASVRRFGAAVTHPFGLYFLALSLALAAAILLLPPLRPPADRAIWMLGLGALSYLATITVLLIFPGGPMFTELESVGATRDAIASLARDLARRDGVDGPSALTLALNRAVVRLDDEIIPALRQLLSRARDLGRQLDLYASGKLQEPDPAFVERLQAIHYRQRHAAGECARQAANAHAALVALLQEGDDDQRIEEQASELAGGLLAIHDALVELLAGDGKDATPEAPPFLTLPLDGRGDDGQEEPPLSLTLPRKGGGDAGRQVGDVSETVALDGLQRLTEEALKSLNNPLQLASCALVGRLPQSIALARTECDPNARAEATSLEQAQALRQTIAASIERLKPASNGNAAHEPEALHYQILWNEYVMGMSAKHVMIRLSLPESTFHRYRREAVAALARELKEQEDQTARRMSCR